MPTWTLPCGTGPSGETTLNRQVRFSVFPREDCDCGRQFSPVGALGVANCPVRRPDSAYTKNESGHRRAKHAERVTSESRDKPHLVGYFATADQGRVAIPSAHRLRQRRILVLGIFRNGKRSAAAGTRLHYARILRLAKTDLLET